MIESDVLVVGGGLAGRMAALASARAGATVRLVSHKQSTLRQASGLVDVLGRVDGDTVADPFGALDSLPPDHPYRTVGAAGIREGLAAFEAAVGDAYRGGHTDRNALVPTSGGTVKPTARYPASVAAGLASDDRDVLLVGFESVIDFDAPLSA
ncbi:MAG: FAD-binding protein, partial [Halobacteriales archaeon]